MKEEEIYKNIITEWIKNKYSDETTDAVSNCYKNYLKQGGQLSFSHFIDFYKPKKVKCTAAIKYGAIKCIYLYNQYECLNTDVCICKMKGDII